MNGSAALPREYPVNYSEFLAEQRFVYKRELKDNMVTFTIKTSLIIIGLVGNTFSIVIFTRKHMVSSVNVLLSSLETMNLFMFLANIPDLTEFLDMDFSFTYTHVMMELVGINVEAVVNFASNWLTVTIGLWRLIAVKFPLKVEIWCSKSRAVKIIVLLVILAVVFTIPQVLLFDYIGNKYLIIDGDPPKTITLYEVIMSDFAMRNDDQNFKIVTGMLLLTTGLPSVGLLVITSLLVLSLWRARSERVRMRITSSTEASKEQRITVTLLVLLLLFLLAYIPDSILNILYQTKCIPLDQEPSAIEWFVTTKIPIIICNASTFFFYYFMSDRFREAFHKLILSYPRHIRDKIVGSSGSRFFQRFSARSNKTLETDISEP